MGRKTRIVEMYIGEGTDFGTWHTEYVDIPIDTPEDKIEEVAKNVANETFTIDYMFVGVYSVPSLDELDDIDGGEEVTQ